MHRSYRKQSGQVLIQVALMIGVLLLMAALAVDVGNIYAERRRMQNAADAGALAGARDLCLGGSVDHAIAVATLYATANGASGAAVIIDGYRVEVEASTAAQMFFAGIVGINSVDVSAVAEAECGCADSPCSVFPMAFDLPTWEDVGCEQEFYDDTVERRQHRPGAARLAAPRRARGGVECGGLWRRLRCGVPKVLDSQQLWRSHRCSLRSGEDGGRRFGGSCRRGPPRPWRPFRKYPPMGSGMCGRRVGIWRLSRDLVSYCGVRARRVA